MRTTTTIGFSTTNEEQWWYRETEDSEIEILTNGEVEFRVMHPDGDNLSRFLNDTTEEIADLRKRLDNAITAFNGLADLVEVTRGPLIAERDALVYEVACAKVALQMVLRAESLEIAHELARAALSGAPAGEG